MLLLLLEKAWQSFHPRLLLSLTTGWSLLSCWFKVRRSYTAFPNGLSLFWFCVFLGPSWSFPLSWVCWELAEKDKALCVPLIFLTPTSKTQAHTCTESNKIPVKLGNRKKKKKKTADIFWSFLLPLTALGHFPLKPIDLNKKTALRQKKREGFLSEHGKQNSKITHILIFSYRHDVSIIQLRNCWHQ